MGKQWNKRLFGAFCALIMMLSLAACGKNDSSSSMGSGAIDGPLKAEDSMPVSGALSGVEPASNAGEDAGAPADTSGPGAAAESEAPAEAVPQAAEVPAGRFYHLDDSLFLSDERTPYLETAADGSAVFQMNTGLALGLASGSYSQSGSTLTFTIDEVEISEPFRDMGRDALNFQVLDADHLKLSGEAYGLTATGSILTREGAGPYVPPAEPPPAPAESSADSLPEDSAAASLPAESLPASMATAVSGADVSGEISSEPAGPTVVAATEAPPSRIKPGDSFLVTGVDFDSILYEAGLLQVEPDFDAGTALFTATRTGETNLTYGPVGGEATEYPLVIAEDGFGLWFLVIVAGASILIGGGVTFVLLSLSRRRKQKAQAATQGGEGGEGGEAAEADPLQEYKQVRAARKKAAKAAEQAKKKHQKAERATAEAAKAAEQAAKAQEALAQAEEKASVAEQKAIAKAAERAAKKAAKALEAAEKAQAAAAKESQKAAKQGALLDEEPPLPSGPPKDAPPAAGEPDLPIDPPSAPEGDGGDDPGEPPPPPEAPAEESSIWGSKA